MKKTKTYQYPWRFNNKFQILIDGAEFFASMIHEIQNAQSSILFEAYLFQSGNTANLFINELCLAKKRNVNVFILLDEYGAKGLSNEDKEKLTAAGIDLLLYNPASIFHFEKSLKRDHRKLLTIDEHTAFIGGAGVTDDFNPSYAQDYWHDVMIKINGDIVPDLVHSFNKIWHKQKPTEKFQHNPASIDSRKTKDKARILISSGTERNEIIRAIISRIRASKNKVWLTTPYFISSWKIRRALRYAAKKGVDVRLMFPGPHSDHKWVTYAMQRYYQRLLKSNIAIYEYQPRFSHAKIILCDDWFTIGSSNLDRWSQFLNLEANIEIYDKHSHQQIVELFETDFSKSNLIILNQWTSRSLIQHVKEWFSGIVIRWLGFISRKFKR